MSEISNISQNYNTYSSQAIQSEIIAARTGRAQSVNMIDMVEKFNWSGSDANADNFTNENTKIAETVDLSASKSFSQGGSVAIEAKALNSIGENNQLYEVYATITKKDGSTERLQITENSIISENENGEIVVQSANGTQGTDKNEIFVMLDNFDELITGSGDDTVLLLNSNTDKLDTVNRLANSEYDYDADVEENYGGLGNKNNINLGEGNNTVIAHSSINSHVNIFAGNGDNTITGVSGNIKVGNGDNTIDANYSTFLIAGNGNNTIDVGILENIKLGNGNNDVEIEKASADIVDVQIGKGNNTIAIDEIDSSALNFTLGNGNNDVKIKELSAHSAGIYAGDGNNNIDINKTEIESMLTASAGDGNNTVNMDVVDTRIGQISFGDGNNDLTINSYKAEMSAIVFGNGNNNVNIDKYLANLSTIDFGDGDNEFTSTIFDGGSGIRLSANNGNNIFQADFFSSVFPELSFGDGNNSVDIDEYFSVLSSISTGTGANLINIGLLNSAFFEYDEDNENTQMGIEKTEDKLDGYTDEERVTIREDLNKELEELYDDFMKE